MHDMNSRTIQTVEHSLDVVWALRKLEKATVSELAEHLDMSPSGIHHHLATLRKRRFVVQEDDKYRLSYLFFNFGQFIKHRTPLCRIAEPQLQSLSKDTSEHAVLITEEFGEAIYLFRSIGKGEVDEEFREGLLEKRAKLHENSVGKAILAQYDRERIEEIIEYHGLPERTSSTITDREELWKELERIREQGYAINNEESVPGIRSIGAPITLSDGRTPGAISLGGPASRMTMERMRSELAPKLIDTANIIQVRIETHQNTPGYDAV